MADDYNQPKTLQNLPKIIQQHRNAMTKQVRADPLPFSTLELWAGFMILFVCCIFYVFMLIVLLLSPSFAQG